MSDTPYWINLARCLMKMPQLSVTREWTPTILDVSTEDTDISVDESSSNEPEQAIEPQENDFLDLTTQIIGNPIQRRYGIAITDIDLNGDYEVVVTGYGAPVKSMISGGSGLILYLIALKMLLVRHWRCRLRHNGDGKKNDFLNVDRFGGLGGVGSTLSTAA